MSRTSAVTGWVVVKGCKHCRKSNHDEQECRHKDAECYRCQKKDISRHSCKSEDINWLNDNKGPADDDPKSMQDEYGLFFIIVRMGKTCIGILCFCLRGEECSNCYYMYIRVYVLQVSW